MCLVPLLYMSPKLLRSITGSAIVSQGTRLLVQGVTTVMWYLFVHWAIAMCKLVGSHWSCVYENKGEIQIWAGDFIDSPINIHIVAQSLGFKSI